MRRVILESPYKGATTAEIARNVAYARACEHFIFTVMGDAPIASHLQYTQPGILRDGVPEERALGIEAGLLWGAQAEVTIVCTDLGITEGMKKGIERAEKEGRAVEYIALGEIWKALDPRNNHDSPCIAPFPAYI